MTRRLILIRHAKSGWDDPTLDDHERVLTERGHASAIAIGHWLAAKGYLPEVMLVSDARRTVLTAELIVAALPVAPALRLMPQLYHASPDTMLDIAARETATTVALVGHNPGMALLANGLVGKPPRHPRFADYPTAATAIIDFDGDIRPGAGVCSDFIVPRELTE